jgi:hypothetical protein
MPGELSRIEAQSRGVVFDDVGHALIAQPRANAAVPVDAAKYCAGLNTGGGDPLFECGDRAGDPAEGNGNDLAGTFLIGLAAPDRDFQSIRRFLDVRDIKRDHL